MKRFFVLLFIFYSTLPVYGFRLPSSVETTSKDRTSIGVDESIFLDKLQAEQVILRVQNGEIDIYLSSDAKFVLDGKNIKIKEGMKIPFRNKIIIASKGSKNKFRDFIRNEIIEQTSYLNGILKSKKLSKSLGVHRGYAGVLGENHTVGGIYIKKVSKTKLTVGYEYYYTKALFSTSVLKNISFISGKQQILVKIPLPSSNERERIYHKSCTDPDYNSFGDYWYFYNPYKKKCSKWLKESSRRVVEVDMVIRKPRHYENSKVYYPEYSRLYKDKHVNMMMIIGYNHYMNWRDSDGEITENSIKRKLVEIESITKKSGKVKRLSNFLSGFDEEDQESYLDTGLENWREMSYVLKSLGFKKASEKSWFSIGYDYLGAKEFPGLNRRAKYLKKLASGETVEFDLVLVDVGISSPDLTFPLIWKEAMEKYEILSYNGHSGLGANLDIDSINDRLLAEGIEKIKFNDQYQILFFNGCSTYSYYNKKYFKAKGGSKNLETILTGLPSWTADVARNNKAFFKTFSNFETISYPRLIKEVDETNHTTGTTLLFLNGEHDNPKTPPR